MSGIKAELNRVADIIGIGRRIAYLDYPLHLNTGDLLIMKGTEAFFRHFSFSPIFRKSVMEQPGSWRLHDDIDESVVLVFHGGGNLGDLYPQHEKFRQGVIGRYRKNRIVILPQTVKFSSAAALAEAQAVYRSHPDLHICARDRASHAAVAGHLSENAYLVPDMAHFLWPLKSGNGDKTSDRLYLMRRDKEANESQHAWIPSGSRVCDWRDFQTAGDVLTRDACAAWGAVRKSLELDTLPVSRVWSAAADRVIERAARALTSCSEVVTSRLHGHIFSSLLGIKNSLVDNSYGKNRTYYETWTHRVAEVSFLSR